MDDSRTRLYLAKQARWQRLIKLLIKNGYHDIVAAHDYAGYIAFLARHPELNLGSDIFPEAPIETRRSSAASHASTASTNPHGAAYGGHGLTGNLLGMLALPALFKKPEIMEQDKKYQKIEEGLKKEWKKNNPAIDTDSKEGLDYLYGYLDNPETPSLAKDAEKKFRELHPKETEKYDKKKTIVYKNIGNDHAVKFTQARIEEHAQKRFVLAKKTNPEVKIEEVRKQVEEKHWRDFAIAYREKATDYAKKHQGIKQAVEKLNKEEVQQQVAAYREVTGKDVRVVEEKIHPMGRESLEATARLEKAAQKAGIQPPTPPRPLIVPSQTIITPKPTIHQPTIPSLVLPQKQEASPSKLVTTKGQPLVSAAPPKQSFVQTAIHKTAAIVKKIIPKPPSSKPIPITPPQAPPPPPTLPPAPIQQAEIPEPETISPPPVPQPQPSLIQQPPPPAQSPPPPPPPLPRRRELSLFDRLFRANHATAGVQYLASPPPAPSSSPAQPQQPSSTGQTSRLPTSSRQRPNRPPRPRRKNIPRLPRLPIPPVSLAINPATLWIIVGAVVFVIVFTFFMVLVGGGVALPELGGGGSGTGGGSSPGTGSVPSIPGLSLQKNGPSQVENATDITYAITVTYAGAQEVTIVDELPDNVNFLTATGDFERQGNTITWPLKHNTASNGAYTFSLTARPLGSDILVRNKVKAKALASTGPHVNSTNFTELMTGQGRNIALLGNDEESFIQKIYANGIGFAIAGKEAYIRQIYQASVAKNVNPLVVATLWGEEQGFAINGSEFGCKPFRSGFAAQLQCSVNTWNNWMNYYDQNKNADGSIVIIGDRGQRCTYSDAFIFAAEKYGPVCAMNDSNENFHRNFVKIYRKLLGLP